MEIKPLLNKIYEVVNKYRFAAIILIIGIVLMMLPANQKEDNKKPETNVQQQLPTVERRLSEILSSVDGAGNTEVLLTVLAGEETIYQVDEQISTGNDTNETEITTITVSGNNKEESGLVRQVVAPTYLGAIVVCEGADHARVKFAIVDAVSKVTGLGADQISVLKMK